MLRDRMQHTVALLRAESCSAYAINAIVSTWKKNFLQIFFRLQKLWNETGELCLIFFLKLTDTILKPLTQHMPRGFLWWDQQFTNRIFRLRSIGMACRSRANATSTYTCSMARLVPHGIVWTYLNIFPLSPPWVLTHFPWIETLLP